ncbi:hypothetical protein ACET3Z_012080 [Daucus carota]
MLWLISPYLLQESSCCRDQVDVTFSASNDGCLYDPIYLTEHLKCLIFLANYLATHSRTEGSWLLEHLQKFPLLLYRV